MQPTPSLLSRMSRKLRLTTKQSSVRGGYYKGTGTGAMGWHTKHGGYRIDPKKVRTYVVPSGLDNCELTPFVTKRLDVGKNQSKKRLNGANYLEKWKVENATT